MEHNIVELRERYAPFIEKLNTEEFFNACSDSGLGAIEWWLGENEGRLGIEYSSGASRVVFWFLDAPDYVFKIEGRVYEDEPEEECDDYGTLVYPGYCKREAENYQKAVKAGLGDYFAWTDFFCNLRDVEIWIMEYCDDIHDTFTSVYNEINSDEIEYRIECEIEALDHEPSDKEYTDIELSIKDRYSYSGEECDVADVLIAIWGNWQYDRFDSFCDTCDINDLHGGNFGRTMNGNVVAIDFAGYWGQDKRRIK